MGIMDQLGAGLAEAGGAVQQMGMKQMEGLIEQQRQEALLSMQETMRDKADTKQADRRLADDDTLTKRRESERKAKVDAYNADIEGQTSIQSDGAINLDATDQANYRQLNPVSEADKRQAAVKAGIMEFTNADSANRNDEQNRINDKKADQQFEISKAQIDRQNRVQEATLSFQKSNAGRAEAQSLRATYTAALKDIRDEAGQYQVKIAALDKTIGDPMAESIEKAKAITAKAIYEKAMEGLKSEGDTLRAEMLKAGGAVVPEAETQEKPVRSLAELAAPDKKDETKDAAPPPKPKATAGASSSETDKSDGDIQVSGYSATGPTRWSYGGKNYPSIEAAMKIKTEIDRRAKVRKASFNEVVE